jgi:hypothetical protein
VAEFEMSTPERVSKIAQPNHGYQPYDDKNVVGIIFVVASMRAFRSNFLDVHTFVRKTEEHL